MKSVYAEGKKSVKQQEQPGDWCDVCGEGILNGDDLQVTEPAWLAFRGEVDREEGKACRRRGFYQESLADEPNGLKSEQGRT